MSLRLQILQVARLAPRLLGDSTDLVRNFFRNQLRDGAGLDRDHKPDLYYTAFALAGLQGLACEVASAAVETILRSHRDGGKLDLVHPSALARCWAAIGKDKMPAGLDRAILDRIET